MALIHLYLIIYIHCWHTCTLSFTCSIDTPFSCDVDARVPYRLHTVSIYLCLVLLTHLYPIVYIQYWHTCVLYFVTHCRYQCQSNTPVAHALKLFQLAFEGSADTPPYAAPPFPPYLEVHDDRIPGLLTEKDDGVGGVVVFDAGYHLLRLSCEKGYRLDRMLNPTSCTANCMDYRLRYRPSCCLCG